MTLPWSAGCHCATGECRCVLSAGALVTQVLSVAITHPQLSSAAPGVSYTAQKPCVNRTHELALHCNKNINGDENLNKYNNVNTVPFYIYNIV